MIESPPRILGLRGFRKSHLVADDRQTGAKSEDDRCQHAAGQLGPQGVLVIVDDLRVLAELRDRDGMERRDARELAELTGGHHGRGLRILGQQHLHRRHLRGLD